MKIMSLSPVLGDRGIQTLVEQTNDFQIDTCRFLGIRLGQGLVGSVPG